MCCVQLETAALLNVSEKSRPFNFFFPQQQRLLTPGNFTIIYGIFYNSASAFFKNDDDDDDDNNNNNNNNNNNKNNNNNNKNNNNNDKL